MILNFNTVLGKLFYSKIFVSDPLLWNSKPGQQPQQAATICNHPLFTTFMRLLAVGSRSKDLSHTTLRLPIECDCLRCVYYDELLAKQVFQSYCRLINKNLLYTRQKNVFYFFLQ